MGLSRPLYTLLSPAGARARLSILIFHRVLPEPDPIFPDEVDAARFTQICSWLRDWANVLPLDEAVARLARQSLPARACAITFDDGYADNHDVALPILQRHGLPATFFIATGFLGGGRMWNDRVIEAVRRTQAPQLVRDGAEPLLLGTPDACRHAIETVLRGIKYLPPAQRLEAVQALEGQLGQPGGPDLMMTPAQVRQLRQAGMQIGGHTVTHPILARLDAAAARAEIAQGRADLQDLLGERVGLFAYPNGKPNVDYLPEHVEMVRALGFDAAVSTHWGAARSDAERHELPRFSPWDATRGRYRARLLRNLW